MPDVKVGIVFPQADIGADPAVIRAFARGVECRLQLPTGPR